jgi:hypothetical protein
MGGDAVLDADSAQTRPKAAGGKGEAEGALRSSE